MLHIHMGWSSSWQLSSEWSSPWASSHIQSDFLGHCQYYYTAVQEKGANVEPGMPYIYWGKFLWEIMREVTEWGLSSENNDKLIQGYDGALDARGSSSMKSQFCFLEELRHPLFSIDIDLILW